jgi:hypothetical protein
MDNELRYKIEFIDLRLIQVSDDKEMNSQENQMINCYAMLVNIGKTYIWKISDAGIPMV